MPPHKVAWAGAYEEMNNSLWASARPFVICIAGFRVGVICGSRGAEPVCDRTSTPHDEQVKQNANWQREFANKDSRLFSDLVVLPSCLGRSTKLVLHDCGQMTDFEIHVFSDDAGTSQNASLVDKTCEKQRTSSDGHGALK